MRILLTGGSGFIGMPLLRRILDSKENHEVLSFGTKRESPCLHERVDWFTADLNDRCSYQEAVREFLPEVVIHLGWEGIPDFSESTCRKNLHNSLMLFQTVGQLDCCLKIIVSGSCFEYGQMNSICNETDVVGIDDYFTWAKNSLRQYLEVMCLQKNITLCWMRIFYAYGPRQRKDALLSIILRALDSGDLPDIRSPRNANDFIYVDDIADGIIKTMETNVVSGIYNLGSGIATTVIDVCREAEKTILGTDEITRKLETGKDEISSTRCFSADINKIVSAVGWEPRTPLNKGILYTWESLVKKE